MNKLDNKKILVTGGNRGIGRSIVEHMAKAGADVIFTYRKNKSQAHELQIELRDSGCKIEYFQVDIKDRKQIEALMLEVKNHWGHLDVLVNNAGINNPTDFDKISDEDWDEILSVNLKGPFVTSQVFFPLLAKGLSSSIINIGSVSGQYGGPRTAHYAASKAGLISLSQVMARFGAKSNIRSNTIAVGLIASEMGNSGLSNQVVSKISENILLGHLGEPADVAFIAVFLASAESRYITGQTFNVNGGIYF